MQVSSNDLPVVERLLRPRSVAIVGVSARPGSAGQVALKLLAVNGFAGDIHLVGRAGTILDGRECLASIDDLPERVDLAILALPATAVREAIEACVRRHVGAAVVFASGFAELGQEERSVQETVAAIARDGGLALIGPNCFGYTNYVDRFTVGFLPGGALPEYDRGAGPALAIISQSGGLMGHLRRAIEMRGVPVSYMISTGNEAGLQLADLLEYLIDDPSTHVIAIYAEHIRRPSEFLAAARKARASGKPIVMMHSGRGAMAQNAARSHTGALASDHGVMSVQTTNAGVALVETLEELIDVSELLTRFPAPTGGGVGIMTTSGAFCAIAHDYCETIGLAIPPLSASVEATLRPRMPAFVPPRNPLDIATQATQDPEIVRDGAIGLLSDPGIGSLVAALAGGSEASALQRLKMLIAAWEKHPKPMILVMFGETLPENPEFLKLARQHRIVLSHSAERALRAIARVTHYGRMLARSRIDMAMHAFTGMPELTQGPQPEWRGKQCLAAAGINVPEGALATSVDEAVAIAERIGFPVAIKAQAATLLHKTEAGGVILNLPDRDTLRTAWQQLIANVTRADPGLTLDGVLVERMAERGLEFVVGARRDPHWGAVLLVGLGGIWIEALGDVRLMPADLAPEAVMDEVRQLRGAALLRGFRGSAPVDVAAIAHTAALVGRIILTMPDLVEIDINPLGVYPAGKGAVALDALLVTKSNDKAV